jgi:hypothetical protein
MLDLGCMADWASKFFLDWSGIRIRLSEAIFSSGACTSISSEFGRLQAQVQTDSEQRISFIIFPRMFLYTIRRSKG